MEKKIQLLLKNLEGCWYDVVGSSECFITEKDKYNYCKQIIKQQSK